jgi:hypothetical protein
LVKSTHGNLKKQREKYKMSKIEEKEKREKKYEEKDGDIFCCLGRVKVAYLIFRNIVVPKSEYHTHKKR